MWTTRVKHLRLIMAVIYLSGALSSDVINTNVTLSATDNMISVENGMRGSSVENTSENVSCVGTTGASDVNAVTSGSEGPSGNTVSESSQCPDRVECVGNATVTYDGDSLRGNGSFGPKKLAFDHSEYVDLGIRETAGFAAVAFLAFSVFGYVGFVLWRRYLQNKYGNGQTLITEDVYDISDLRHFEI